MSKQKQTKQNDLFAPGELPEQPRIEFVAHLSRPPVPSGSYKPPIAFPMFGKSAKRVTIDFETHDPDLTRLGTGIRRGDTYAVGVGVRIDDEWGEPYREYYPMRHDYGENCDAEKVEEWLRDNLNNFEGEICGANVALYDGDIAQYSGIRPKKAKWRDVQWAEALIDENAMNYYLDRLGKKYLGEGKVKADLVSKYGKDFIKNFREVHPAHARDYVLGDIDLPSGVLDKQYEVLKNEGLTDLFDLESRQVPLLHYLRRTGVRVDAPAAREFGDILEIKRDQALVELSNQVGFDVNYDNYEEKVVLARIFDTLKIPYPMTEPSKNYPNGQPSFTKLWLDNLAQFDKETGEILGNIAAGKLTKARGYEKARGTFIEGYIGDFLLGDRLHCEFHPLRRADEEGKRGTASGRYSCTHPNLQNIPIRDTFIGPMIRAMFLPEVGANWFSLDYSQIEYRFLVHFAVLLKCVGAMEARQKYIDDPKMDFHMLVVAMTGLNRAYAKNLNFGLCLDENERLLTTDLQWKSAGSIRIGDALIGFDEQPQGRKRRRFRKSFVEHIERFNRPCVRVITDQGDIICSEEHLWLARQEQGTKLIRKYKKNGGARPVNANGLTYEWTQAKYLRPGQTVPMLGKPWETLDTKLAGWLAGIADGEGTVSAKGGRGRHNSLLAIVQNPGPVLEEIKRALTHFGFTFSEHSHGDSSKAKTVLVTGGRDEFLRFLGSVRPLRLLPKAENIWDGAACWSGITKKAKVIAVESLGVREVVSIRTSTKTFIVEGLLSHNCYGMGIEKLARTLGMIGPDGKPTQKAVDTMNTYHEKAPFVKALMSKSSAQAQDKGFVRTILGRRSRFEMWEPKKYSKGVRAVPLPYDQALIAYGDKIQRSETHKALNRILQGSAADLMKRAMVNIWESGVLDEGNDIWLHLQVHDELDGSVLPTLRGERALAEVKNIMETAMELQVPIYTGGGTGKNWAEAH